MLQNINAKTILSKLRSIDWLFGISYNMNLYRGCQHSCIYCDTRSECYGIGDISRISVKQNAIELLRKELKSKAGKKGTVGTGSMNDPYMPVEKETGIVRKALGVLADYRFPVHIITKSDLVTRDTDILCELSRIYAAVSMTITTFDDALASRLEPHASTTSQRFATIEHLARNGIYTGITLMPLLPFINDSPENVRNILRRAKDSGASYVIPMFGLTLRKGSRDYFYQALDDLFPGMKQKYQQRYGEQYECQSPEQNRLWEIFREEKLPGKMKFYTPEPDGQMSLFE